MARAVSRFVAVRVALVVSGAVWFGCARDQDNLTAPASPRASLSAESSQQPGLERAMGAQQRNTDRLLAIARVVGTAVGFTRDGRPAVKIYTSTARVAGLPENLEGIPVVVEATGAIVALQDGAVDNTAIFPPPVPIGVSTGNEGQCSAGTISARVKDAGGTVYALSNNHVYALENTAPIGSKVLQPGLVDTDCAFDGNNVLGTLFAFQPIVFERGANNTIDAAIAVASLAALGNATPTGGYGIPNSTTAPATINQVVQKYGRTTSLTHGIVTAIHATVLVGYSSGTARFANQVIVQSGTQFIGAGDSGSLLVTDDVNDNPVGLLFAGNGSGTLAVGNPITLVLSHFGVTVDGK